jgi:transposase
LRFDPGWVLLEQSPLREEPHEEVQSYADRRGTPAVAGADHHWQGRRQEAYPCPHPPQGRCRRGRPGLGDQRIADATEVSTDTVARVRQRFIEHGLEAALTRKKQDRPSRERKLDGRAEARLIALACSAPPDGRKEWTMKLLAGRLVELEVVDTVSDETVRRVLKKTNSSRG